MKTPQLIIITAPDFLAKEQPQFEAQALVALLQAGANRIHLRKPGANAADMEALIQAIPAEYYPQLSIHDFLDLAVKYNLGGIHLNSRNSQVPDGYKGLVSRSCHSFEEVQQWAPELDYVTISPVFDSISKPGYNAAFSLWDLERAAKTWPDNVYALGGVSVKNIHSLPMMGLAGGLVLGAVWNQPSMQEAVQYVRDMVAELHRPFTTPVKVASIAGSDPSGGAGIQADMKAITALGGYASTAITALTIQNTLGVTDVFPVPIDVVQNQIQAILEDIQPQAVKIGMVNDANIVRTIAANLRKYQPANVVYDPVMVSTSGHKLIEDNTIGIIEQELMPLASLITPNMQEAEVLYGEKLGTVERMEVAAEALSKKYGCAVLVKGGHLEGHQMCDILYHNGRITRFSEEKVDTPNLHGTGCTLSSSIATFLAKGCRMEDAVDQAKKYVTQAIQKGSTLYIGHGNGPLWHLVK